MRKLRLPKFRKVYLYLLYFLVLGLPALFFFVNYLRDRVQGVGLGYEATDLIGQKYYITNNNNNNNPTSEGLETPMGSDTDEVNHKLYVSDYGNYRVLVYNLDVNNVLIDKTADFVLGQTSFDNSIEYFSEINATSFQPSDLTVDPESETLFVVDQPNARILIFDVSNISNGMAASGVLGQTDFVTSTGGVTQSKLSVADSIDFDTVNNRLFVTDATHRVLIMNFDPLNYTNGQNFDYVLGQNDFTSNSCAGTTDATICTPRNIAWDSSTNYLYIVDSTNHRVLVFDVSTISNGESAIYVFGQPDFTSGVMHGGSDPTSSKGFNNPFALELDSTGQKLFVTDFERRVYVYDIASISNNEDAVNVLGQSSFSSFLCNSEFSASITCDSYGLSFIDSNNKLLVSDSAQHRILLFDVTSISDGENAVDVLGQVNFTNRYPNGVIVANSSGFDYPTTLEIDDIHHKLYVGDTYNGRVLVFNLDSQNELIDSIADYVIGKPNFNETGTGCTEGVDINASSLCGPYGVHIDSENSRLFVSDSEANRVLIYDVSSNNLANGMSADYVLGQPDFVTATFYEDTTASNFNWPTRVQYEKNSDYLYVVDNSNNRILGFDISNTISNGMPADRILGQVNFTSNSSNGGIGINDWSFDGPYDLVLDEENSIMFVSDTGNGRVLGFDIYNFSNGMSASNVLGASDFVTPGGTTTESAMNYPAGLGIDQDSKLLFITDTDDHRVVVFDIDEISNGEDAIAVLGQPNFTFHDYNQDYSTPFEESLYYPYDFSNITNSLAYVADSENHRILQYKFARITETSVANGDSGVAYNQPLTVVNDQGTPEISLHSGTLPPGLTLNASSITGTPTTTGTYNFTLEVSDDNGSNGVFRQLQEFTILIDPELIDTDGDGTTDVIEQASPNSGDANNDNTDDDQQDNVTSIINPLTNNYVTVESNCNANDNVDVDPNTGDTAFSYPYGMTEFTVTCTNPGDSATIELYFYEPEDANSYVLRKFDGTDYDTVGDYSIQELTIGGESVIKVTYNIIDGGVLDQDGIANGTIVDPVGLAENSVGTPNTGLGGSASIR